MSDFETIFTVKSESIDDYNLLLQIWKNTSEASIENMDKTNQSVVEGKFLDFLITYATDGYDTWMEEC